MGYMQSVSDTSKWKPFYFVLTSETCKCIIYFKNHEKILPGWDVLICMLCESFKEEAILNLNFLR